MSKVTVTNVLHPRAITALRNHMQAVLAAGAKEAIRVLADNVDDRGPASKWPQFPRQQTGDLYSSVAGIRPGPYSWEVGFFDEPMEKLLDIEFGSPDTGGRAPLQRTMEDPETHELMMQAISRVPAPHTFVVWS